jgi:hypothetical protein
MDPVSAIAGALGDIVGGVAGIFQSKYAAESSIIQQQRALEAERAMQQEANRQARYMTIQNRISQAATMANVMRVAAVAGALAVTILLLKQD